MRAWTASLAALLLLIATAPARGSNPPARFVIRDGRRIAMHVIPGRSPPIVLDAGGGLDSSYWSAMAPRLARATGAEIVSYDRPGFGASDPAPPGPWSVLSARDDLAAVLRSLGPPHGVVLVSHSLAGEIALYLAQAHPGWLSGAVLVDANVPQVFTAKMIAAETAAMTPEVAAARREPANAADRQLVAVADSFAATSEAFHRQAWPRTVPAIVIVSEKTPFGDPAGAQLWRDAHAAFAREAPNRSLVVAAGSSHDVAHDRPDVVLAAVVRMEQESGRGRR